MHASEGARGRSREAIVELHEALFASALAVCASAAFEAARVPARAYGMDALLLPQLYRTLLAQSLVVLAPVVAYVPALALLRVAVLAGGQQLPARARSGALPAGACLLSGLSSLWIFNTLILYEDFARYPPARAAAVALFAATATLSVATVASRPAAQRGGHAWLGRLLTAGALLGACLAYGLDLRLYKDEYPTLHLSLLASAHLMLSLGLWRCARSLRPTSPRFVRPHRLALALWLPVVLIAAIDAGGGASIARARPYFLAYTTLGQSRAELQSYRERVGGEVAVAPLGRALERFARDSGLPELAADFSLTDVNLLLVMVDTMRMDQTSLANPALATTPELSAWSERGGLVFERAYAPSGGTFQSMAGLFQMTYPSFVELEVWAKAWQGRMLASTPSVPELFAGAGYETFWHGHNNADCFTHTTLGLDRGFAHVDLLTAAESASPEADKRIAGATLSTLERFAKSGERFFGWTFFVSPHHEYLTHDQSLPHATDLERYRQELRAADRAFGELMSGLSRLDLLRRTIVVFASDHGEEFEDHGGAHHKSSVYSEVVQVPLVVWLPEGVAADARPRGERIAAPTSTLYLFPWLLQHGTRAMRDAAVGRLRRDIAPLMERTDGAVLVELIGNRHMQSTLVYADRKYNYDFVADLYRAYALDTDPREQRDLFRVDPAFTADATARFHAYRGLRAARARFEIRRDRKDPRR